MSSIPSPIAQGRQRKRERGGGGDIETERRKRETEREKLFLNIVSSSKKLFSKKLSFYSMATY
jgi:hypothetical protein